MNLVLDFGNTRIKAGVFDGATLAEKHIFENDEQLIQSPLMRLPVENCLIASVTKNHHRTKAELEKRFRTEIYNAATPIPLKNNYKSALTLGSDRVAASVGSFSLYPSQNVLTVDAGTCIKFNFVNSDNEYLGGCISPGIPMRLKAMNHYTQALPLVETDLTYHKLIGQSTSESLLSGALLGAACEVDGMITRYLELYPDLQVVLTGGDSDYLSSQLKNRFFAHQNILLYGLNTIINYNLEK